MALNRWWVIHDEDIGHALQRVAEGEDPWVVHIELYASSRSEPVPPEQEENP